MKINLVSDATYYPVRVGQNNKPAGAKPAGPTQQAENVNQFGKVFMQNLSPTEATAIRKLFGDFNSDTDTNLKPDTKTSSGNRGTASRGRFVDITV